MPRLVDHSWYCGLLKCCCVLQEMVKDLAHALVPIFGLSLLESGSLPGSSGTGQPPYPSLPFPTLGISYKTNQVRKHAGTVVLVLVFLGTSTQFIGVTEMVARNSYSSQVEVAIHSLVIWMLKNVTVCMDLLTNERTGVFLCSASASTDF